MRKGGKVVQPISGLSPNLKPMDDDQTDGGTFVDHLSTEKDPFYDGEDAQDKGGGNQQGDSTSDPVKPAVMTDAPNLPAGADIEADFEVCAYCLGSNGRADTSKSLGCVKVKFLQKVGKGGVAEVGGDKVAPPSEEHKKAVEKFDGHHVKKEGESEKRECPDTGLKEPGGIKQPIDLFDTTEPPSDGPSKGGMKQPVDWESTLRPILDRFFAEKFGGASAGPTILNPAVREFAELTRRSPHVASLGYQAPQVLAVKWTNVGFRIKNHFSMILQSPGPEVDLAEFAAFKSPCVDYTSDDVALQRVTVSPISLEGIAEAVLAADRRTELTNPAVSVMVLYCTVAGQDGREVLMARDQVSRILSNTFNATAETEVQARKLMAVWNHTFSLV